MATKKQECMIIGASPIEDDAVFREFPPENYYVICADAGYETAERYGITPDLVVGDFDSAKTLPPKGNKVLTLPVEKDVTDTMYAVIKGFAKGYRSFVLVGCLGGARFDHSRQPGGAPVHPPAQRLRRMADSHTKVFLIAGSRLRLTEMKGATVSCSLRHRQLPSPTRAAVPLAHDTFTSGGVLMGVSNTITADTAVIRVHAGTALVVVYTA
ncbi:MAG: thiamine diphosphokinase [Acutalibacter sp.]